MHSMQIGRRTMYVHTHSVYTYIHINICKYIYRHLHTDVIVPEYSIISFPSATSFQLLCGSPASLSGNVYERFCATVRTHFECTCEFALVHPTQTATPAELTPHTNTHIHTLEKINENKKKTDTERRQMWRKAMMAQAQQRTQLQTRLIIARAGESSVCVCLRLCAWERQRIQRAQKQTLASAFSFKPPRTAYKHTYTCSRVCVCVRESEGALSLSLCVRCALHLTLPLIPFSTLWAGVGFLTRSLTHLRWRHSLALSPPRSRILFDVRSREVGFVVSLTAVGF